MNLTDYEDVDTRLHAFWKAHPNGRVSTRLEHIYTDANGGLVSCVVSAAVYRDQGDEHPAGTGLAQEQRSERGVNAAFALEACETSSIGRALANMGYSTKGKRPSREEMTKVAEVKAAKAAEPTMGEAIGTIVEAMPGSRIIEQGASPAPRQDRDKAWGVAPGNETAPASKAMFGKAAALARSIGLVKRDENGQPVEGRYGAEIDWDLFGKYASDVLGAPVTTIKGMGKADLSAVIDAMARDEAAQSNAAEEAANDNPWAEHP